MDSEQPIDIYLYKKKKIVGDTFAVKVLWPHT